MNLYVVDYRYYDAYEKRDVRDRWFIACEDDEQLRQTMELNFKEFERCGYKPSSYSFQVLTETDNGFTITLNNEVK